MRLCHLHLARFPLQRKVVENPSMAGKPLALVEKWRGARRVAFASGSAMRAGIRPGMTLAAATALEASLASFEYQPEAERAALLSLGEALLSLAPAFELSPPEGLWLDASAAPLSGGEAGLLKRAKALCAQAGYRAQGAIASERFTARALARYAQEPGVVEAEESASALAALPLAALEDGALRELCSLGLSTLGEVGALPPGAVVARLGARGLAALRLARGEDDTPFTPQPLPERFEESVSLEWPAESMEPLLFSLKTALDRLCARLWGRRRAAVRLTLALELYPSGKLELPLLLARPSSEAKLLLELARHLFSELSLESPVGALTVRVEESCDDPGQQLVLGEQPSGDAALEVVLSRLSTTLGEGSLFSAQLVPTHRPEAGFAPGPFRPPQAEKPSLEMEDPAWRARPSRLFEKPRELPAELGEQGQLAWARLLGKRRKVSLLAGPERLCGEWWGEAPYSRDYYRVHLEGLGQVWIYRDGSDGRFYLQGMFD